jgi:Transposase DDE domain
MHNIVDPKQTRLFDPFSSVLTEKTRKRLLDGWPGVFRHIILELMPVDAVSKEFDPTMGRPTKELYSMAGLLLIKEFMNWTKAETLDAYSFNINIHYALNLEPVAHDLSMRSLERYINLFEDNDVARLVMSKITAELVKLLELKIDKQRLDSTHVFSDMASFGRTRLMGVAVKRFLTQLKRHDPRSYNELGEAMLNRYAPGVGRLFADTRDDDARRVLRKQIAEDMYTLLKLFAARAEHSSRSTYKALERIFYEQCEVHEEAIVVKEHSPCDALLNSSDPDATYDGHKGPGYQVQIAETYNCENDIQLITSAIAQTAVESDTTAFGKVMEDMKGSELSPKELLADTVYCSDDNVQLAQEHGVELIGPTPKSGTTKSQDNDKLNIDDFDIDEKTEEVLCCPAGHKPLSSVNSKRSGKTKTVMPKSACSECDFLAECPIKKKGDEYILKHTARQRRNARRRREENTEAFRQQYRMRSGIESTHSGLKRRTGLGHLRVRGRRAVFNAIYFKIAGWNILRAAVCAKMRQIVHARVRQALCRLNYAILRMIMAARNTRISWQKYFYRSWRQIEMFSMNAEAA